MQQIESVIGTICMATFALGLLYEIVSFTKTAKIIKFVMAVYIISTVINSANMLNIDMNNPEIAQEIPNYTYSDNLINEVIQQTEQNVATIIKNRLTEKNISYNQVRVHILEQNGELIVAEIDIECENINTEDAASTIADIIDENTKVNIGA